MKARTDFLALVAAISIALPLASAGAARGSQGANSSEPSASLRAADDALDAARRSRDTIEEALAQEARAVALQSLDRTEDARAAWEDAAQLWEASGAEAQRIRAVVRAALICVPPRNEEAEELLDRGLSSLRLEMRDLDAVAQALFDSGVEIFEYSGADHELDRLSVDYLRAALAIREKQAPQSRRLVETLNALAYVLVDMGMMYTDESFLCLAKDDYLRAVEIGQRVAPESPELVQSMSELGYCEHMFGDYERARDHYLEALRIQRRIAPDGTLPEAEVLRRLGQLESDGFTDFLTAHPYLEEAVALNERLAPGSAGLEKSLENLGALEDKQGDPVAARALLERALAIKRELPGNLSATYINLGMVAADQYDFAAARTYLERALAISQERFPDSMNVPFALSNLALTFYREGDLASAYDYERRALARLEDKSSDSLDVTEDFVLMGEILRDQGTFESAAEYFRRAYEIRQKLTPESLNVSDALVHLATLERARGNRAAAIEDDRRALEISRKACPSSWCASGILHDLGQLAYERGDLAAAEGYFREAVDLREKSLGPGHPDLARSLNGLARTLASAGKNSEARQLALRAERIGAEHLRLSARTLSERQALAYEDIRASGLDVALTVGVDGAGASSAGADLFDAVIQSRALVFDELAARHRGVHGSGDTETADLSDRLLVARRRLATLAFRGAGESTPEVYRALLAQAGDEKETAERRLAERSAAFRQDRLRAGLGLQEIAASLPPGTVLVAYVRYARLDLRGPASGRAPRAPVPSYAAFILETGQREPVFVRLGPAHRIEGSVGAWRRDLARRAAAPDGFADDEGARRLGADLRRLIWDPVASHIPVARDILVVPDAALHLVSLASLPSGSSEYLVETRRIHYLSTERDLVPVPSRHGEGILVVGNPAFDRSAAPDRVASLRGAADQPPAVRRRARSTCGTFRALRFSPLPASQREVEDIAELWRRSAGTRARGVEPAAMPGEAGELLAMTREDASPEAFEQSAPGRRVLHVATHGFFLEGGCGSALQLRSAGGASETGVPRTKSENPLLLSGLAFAGANRRASAGDHESDGILTAEEIAGIDLEGVDWAVLSACDTGVGEIKVGEGVFGLRRSFQVAGARTVIMSLWPVDDETTRRWMATLYREHFLEGKDTPESVRAATLQALNARRARHLSTHPFYWGAFIAAGDWH